MPGDPAFTWGSRGAEYALKWERYRKWRRRYDRTQLIITTVLTASICAGVIVKSIIGS